MIDVNNFPTILVYGKVLFQSVKLYHNIKYFWILWLPVPALSRDVRIIMWKAMVYIDQIWVPNEPTIENHLSDTFFKSSTLPTPFPSCAIVTRSPSMTKTNVRFFSKLPQPGLVQPTCSFWLWSRSVSVCNQQASQQSELQYTFQL